MATGAPGWTRARKPSARDKTRHAIVDAALRLFAEHGYIGVRVEDIARESGVSRATFYKHFAERDEILAELFGRLLDDSAEPEVVDDVDEDVDDLEAHVTGLLNGSIDRMMGEELLARFVYSLPVRHDAVLPGGAAAPGVFERVRTVLAGAAERGLVRDDVTVERALEVLGRVFEAAMRDWAEGRADDPRQRLAELVSIVFRGVSS